MKTELEKIAKMYGWTYRYMIDGKIELHSPADAFYVSRDEEEAINNIKEEEKFWEEYSRQSMQL